MIFVSKIHSKHIPVHTFKTCDPISSIYGLRKAPISENLIPNKTLQEELLFFTTINVSNEEI